MKISYLQVCEKNTLATLPSLWIIVRRAAAEQPAAFIETIPWAWSILNTKNGHFWQSTKSRTLGRFRKFVFYPSEKSLN